MERENECSVVKKKKKRNKSCDKIDDNESEYNISNDIVDLTEDTGIKEEPSSSHTCNCPTGMMSKNDSVVVKNIDSLNRILDKKVPWNGYSPLHHIVSGKQTGELAKLLELGYVRNKGKWMPEEIEQLNENMKEFIEDHDVKDFKSLIRNRTKEQKMFRRKTHFLQKISKGISRTGFDVGNRIYTQFATFLKRGRYSKEEMMELKRLHSILGNNWKQIGLHLNRNHWGMSDIYHNGPSKDWNKGPWTLGEKKSLLNSVINFFEKNEPVAWKTVSNEVQSKSSKNCRGYWCNRFSQIRNRDAYRKWLLISEKDEDDIENVLFDNQEILKLITFISDANIDDGFLVDWSDLIKYFDHVTSPAWLKWKFQAVCKEVPQSHRLEFTDLIEQLIEIYEKKVREEIVQIVD